MALFNSVPLAKRYLALMPVTLPEMYEHRKPLQRARLEYDDEVTAPVFDIDFCGKDVLDLGCGYGGRPVRYKELGARSVVGIEPHHEQVEEAAAFGRATGFEIIAVCGFGESIPIKNESVDLITSSDVFEHVESLPQTLHECYRVLRKGGTLHAAFPPFYNPIGGSHLHGYVSRSPAPNVLFSCAALRTAMKELLAARGDWRPRDRPTDALPSVNGTTIAEFFGMLKALPFSREAVRLEPLTSRRFWFINLPAAIGTRIPILREVCTQRIWCELTK